MTVCSSSPRSPEQNLLGQGPGHTVFIPSKGLKVWAHKFFDTDSSGKHLTVYLPFVTGVVDRDTVERTVDPTHLRFA